jgi:hypothetical protein
MNRVLSQFVATRWLPSITLENAKIDGPSGEKG